MRYILFFIIPFIAIWSISCERPNSQKTIKNKLLGSWNLEQVSWVSTDTSITIEKAQPGILMFSPKRYSLIWTPVQEKRKAFEILARPTENEISEGFKSIVFNTGNYSFTDSSIITTANLAKVPGFEGGKQFYHYRLKDSLMHLVFYDEIYPNGSKPDWSGKWETRFTLKRIDSL